MEILAYGQTGTGKTWTMEGQVDSDEKQGVIPRSVRAIFEELEARQADVSAPDGLMIFYFLFCLLHCSNFSYHTQVLCQSVFP